MKHFSIWGLLLLATACYGQQPEIAQHDKDESRKGKWQVHKEYDENGNLIKYDSIYVWSSHDLKKFPKTQQIDSLLNSYRSFMLESDLQNREPVFSFFENTDSLFNNNFFDDAFFSDNWNQIYGKHIQQMMQQMDSLRRRFIQNNYPNKAILNNKGI